MSLDLDELLVAHFEDLAVPVRSGSLDSVMRQGRGRRARQRRNVATASALAVLALGVAVVPRFGGGSGRVKVGSETSTSASAASTTVEPTTTAKPISATPVDASELAPFVPSKLVWTKVASPEAAPLEVHRQADGTYLGLFPSGESGRVLSSSADAIRWTPVVLPDNFVPVSARKIGTVLRVLGSTPLAPGRTSSLGLTATFGDLIVADSTPSGGWQLTALPISEARLAERAEVTSWGRLAQSGDATVVVASTSVYTNGAARLPKDAPFGSAVQTVSDGVEIFGGPPVPSSACSEEVLAAKVRNPPPSVAPGEPEALWFPPGVSAKCVAEFSAPPVLLKHYSWAELGIDPDVRSSLGGHWRVFASNKGGPFGEVTLPATDRSTTAGVTIRSTDKGFVLLRTLSESNQTDLYRSSDGIVWSGPELVVGRGASDLEERNGQLIAVVSGPSSTGEADVGLLVIGDSVKRTAGTASLIQALNFGNLFDVGPYGFGSSGTMRADGSDPLIVDSEDGSAWGATRLRDLVPTSANEVARVVSVVVDEKGLVATVSVNHRSPSDAPTKLLTFVGRPTK
jgi:hypothetical protein